MDLLHAGLLNEIHLPNTLTTINNSAFQGCYSLSELTIPVSVTTIGTYALHIGTAGVNFGKYTSLENFKNNLTTTISIPSTLATITFLSTTPPSIQSSTFNKTSLNKIIVPAGCGEAYRTATNWTTVADNIEEATA